MIQEEQDADEQEADAWRHLRSDPPLNPVPQRDVGAAAAVGDRLAASGDPDAVPLPVVRLPSPGDDGERQ